MKKTIVAISLLSTLAVQAQVSPTANHESTQLTESEGQQVWKTMRTDFESGSECFNRAESWTYDVNKKFGYEAKKILIHYSYQYNKELSAKWGFHIAPMYNIEGEDVVFDKGFQPWLHAPVSPKMWEQKFLIAGTDKLVEKRIKLKEKAQKLQEAIYDLDKSSEFYYDSLKSKTDKLKEVKAEMKAFKVTDSDLKNQRPKKVAQVEKWIEYLSAEIKGLRSSSSTYRSLKYQLDYQIKLLRKVNSDLDYAAHIECQKIDSIEELDYTKTGAWCFIQEVSQYYWGVPQLRLLNYGPGHGMNTLPKKHQLPQARRNGEQYAHNNDFSMNDVWTARKQAFGTAYKEIWSKEYQLKEDSSYAVKNIHKVIKKVNKAKKEAQDLYSDIIKVTEQRSNKLSKYANTASTYKSQALSNVKKAVDAKDVIYSLTKEVSVSATKAKVSKYHEAENALTKAESSIEKLESILDKAEDKLKSIKKAEKEQNRRNRRNRN